MKLFKNMREKDRLVVITNLIVIVLLGGVLYTLLGLVDNVDEESFACFQDPLGYGAGKLKEANGAEFSCTCSLNKVGSPILYFDSQTKELIYPKIGQFSEDAYRLFNFSELDIVVSE